MLKYEDIPFYSILFGKKCLRSILGMTLQDHVWNKGIKQALSVEKTISDIICKKRMQWFGHVCCQLNSSYVKIVCKEDFGATN